jgi:hypothetical protein
MSHARRRVLAVLAAATLLVGGTAAVTLTETGSAQAQRGTCCSG